MILASKDITDTNNHLILRIGGGSAARRMSICNRTSGALKVRLWFVPKNVDVSTASIDDKYAIYYDAQLTANQTLTLNEQDMKLTSGEQIWFRTDTSGVSVTVMD